ncbi:MAG: SDR family NAD(P)-dependent oxidoreductase [Bacteroidota bacterium]
MNLRLDGRKALVCGSSKGIGRAVAYRFAEMGADVILTARSEELLNKHINEMPNNGRQKHDYLAADFQEPDKLILAMRKKFGNEPEINILVNNSGGPPPGLLHKAGPGDFIKAVERHLISSHLLMKLLLPHMKKNSWGRIINIISISVKQPVDNLGVSNTLRGAMNSWSKTPSIRNNR